MRIGFSTGSLARGDVRAALRMLRHHRGSAVELSALRVHELEPLMRAVPRLDLTRYRHISVHAPSAFSVEEEEEVVRLLLPAACRGWAVVLHPDSIHDVKRWRPFGDRLCIENMDVRKPGRTAEELTRVFELLPEARLCFDIAHVRQVDPSMLEAFLILEHFSDRLAEVHVSELDASCRHGRLTPPGVAALREVGSLIPAHIPAIIEAPVSPSEIEHEIAASLEALGRSGSLRSAA